MFVQDNTLYIFLYLNLLNVKNIIFVFCIHLCMYYNCDVRIQLLNMFHTSTVSSFL